jgi:hypothetical protein
MFSLIWFFFLDALVEDGTVCAGAAYVAVCLMHSVNVRLFFFKPVHFDLKIPLPVKSS